MESKIYSFIGLAKKANRMVSGDETCERIIKKARAALVIVTDDASDNTKKKYKNLCNYKNVQYRVFGSKDLLGKYLGKDIRSVIVITESGFANKLIEMIDKEGLKTEVT